MADTSVKLSGTYDSIEAYNIMVEMQNMSADYEEIRTEAAAAASAATAAVTTAQTAANSASTYAGNAQTYAGNASDSADDAAGYASNADTSATNAASSATDASNSAAAAATSETNAALSASSAAASEAVVNGALPLSGGTMTGPLLISADISSPTDDSNIGINGGTARNKGAWLSVWGKDHATYPGWFGIHANNGTDDGVLIGRPNGSLTWNNKTVITGTEYSQTFTTNKLAANADQNFTLTAQPKYWSVICNSGAGWAGLIFAVNGGKSLRVTNKNTSTLAENVNFTIHYIA